MIALIADIVTCREELLHLAEKQRGRIDELHVKGAASELELDEAEKSVFLAEIDLAEARLRMPDR
jgi:outer membrane protein TolC